ncbi:MAG: hypothetical protein CSB24_05680 [Deltaproteobacteria bacterium]|nr:MAG: hypothetical protein CSB24_05680 [Deltaproteobacteria bacterium]
MNFSIRPPAIRIPPSQALDKAAGKERQLHSLRESTREFEAIYINEMFKAMRKTIPETGLFSKSMSTEMFQEMMDMELARQTAQGDGIGLGLAMYNQMKGIIESRR